MQAVRIACAKRPIAVADIERIVSQLEEQVFSLGRAEVRSEVIGRMALEKLKPLDPLAYIRFAIVYLQIDGVQTLRRGLDRLMAEHG
jgi:transcriptional repressor NrdR